MTFSFPQKLSLLSALLVVFTASTVSFVFYQNSADILVENIITQGKQRLHEEKLLLVSHIRTLREDTGFLSKTPPVEGMIRASKNKGYDRIGKSSYTLWTQRLVSVFSEYLKYKPRYYKMRFIDASGQELVHVTRLNNKITITPEAELQNKAHRPYVINTLKIKKGSMYLSDFNLNREHGKVTLPHQQVLRVGIPVFEENSERIFGLIIISSSIDSAFSLMAEEFEEEGRAAYITNQYGDYLLSPASNKNYGFEFDKRYNLFDERSYLKILLNKEQADSSTVYLPEDTGVDELMIFHRYQFDPENASRFIIMGFTQSYSAIVADQRYALFLTSLWASGLIILGVILSLLFSRKISLPMKKLTETINNIDYSQLAEIDLPISRNDEVGHLSRAFSYMTNTIMQNHDKLQKMNNNLESLIGQRTEDLQKSEIYQRTILEQAIDGIITIDLTGKIQSFNPAAEKLFGYSLDEVIHKDVNILMPGKYKNTFITQLKEDGASSIVGQSREFKAQHKDGTTFPVSLGISEMIIDEHRIFSGIVRDISEQKRIEKMKNEFISTISHELRTPLTSIKGSLGLMIGGVAGELPKEANDLINLANNNTDRLLMLINEILDSQKIKAGKFKLSFKTTDLNVLLKDAIKSNLGFAEQYGVTINFLEFDGPVEASVDPARLMQVMDNLLSNACKFSSRDSIVQVSLTLFNETWRITVQDKGVGITDDFHEKLFNRFTQADSSDSRALGGTGLGLSIVKAIIELHHGKISFTSKQNQGTAFFIDLPLVAPAVNEAAILKKYH